MKTIRINAGAPYDVLVGSGLLDRAGALIQKTVAPCRTVLVTDSNVAPLYAAKVEKSMAAAGYTVTRHVFPAGEPSKNMETLTGILTANKLVNYRLKKLEEKVQAHNNLVERTYKLEGRMCEAEHNIRDLRNER